MDSASSGATPLNPGVVILNNEVTITGISIQARSNVELRSTNGTGKLTATQNQPALELHNTLKNSRFTNILFSNTLTASALQSHAGCVESYYDCFGSNIYFTKCSFTVPSANMNAISLAPYSPSAVGGAGAGNILSGIYFEDCVAYNVGRGFLEVTTHVQDDGKRMALFQNAYFSRIKLTNLGSLSTDNPKFGAGFSISGPSWNTNFTDIEITDATYAGIEGVAARDMTIRNLKTISTNGNYFAAIALSATYNLGMRCKDVEIINCSGSALGRFVAAQDVDGLYIRGGTAYTAQRNSYDRITDLRMRVVNWSVNRGNENNEGGQTLHIKDCPAIDIADCEFYLTNGSETNYSIVETEGTTTGTIKRGKIDRPAGGNDLALKIYNSPQMSAQDVEGWGTTLASPVQLFTSGSSVTMLDYKSTLLVNPSSTLANLTINLPASLKDNQEIHILFGGTITSGAVVTNLTVSAASGIIQTSPITNAAAGDALDFLFSTSAGKYYAI